MFFYEVEGHMQKLSSFGRGKKIRPKESLAEGKVNIADSVPRRSRGKYSQQYLLSLRGIIVLV